MGSGRYLNNNPSLLLTSLYIALRLVSCSSGDENSTATPETNCVLATAEADKDGDGYTVSEGDCDDSDPLVYSGAIEYCDQEDNNCNNNIDEDVGDHKSWYLDDDGDGFGDPNVLCVAYGGGNNYITIADDCNDQNPEINPNALDICDDGIDPNCDQKDATCGIWGTSSLADSDAILTGEYAGDRAGRRCDCSGLTLDDGYDDLLLGVSGYDDNKSDNYFRRPKSQFADNKRETSGNTADGAAYLLYGPVGGTHLLTDVDARFYGEYDSLLGSSVDQGIDLTADGIVDIVIGISNGYSSHNEASDPPGKVLIFCDSPMGIVDPADACVSIYGTEAGGAFGTAVCSDGDFNGDGNADLVVGAGNATGTTEEAGRILVFYGPIFGEYSDDDANVIILGDEYSSGFGNILDCSSDINGDEATDLVIGIPHDSSSACEAGAILGFFGPLEHDKVQSDSDVRLYSRKAGDSFGSYVSTGGDTDGDGFSDLLVGAPSSTSYCSADDPTIDERGSAYLFLGPMGPGNFDATMTWNAMFEGDQAEDHAGADVTLDGDLNDDGYFDVVIGAQGAGDEIKDSGAAVIFYGPVAGYHTIAEADATAYGESENSFVGVCVLSGCDLNGDSYHDLVVGATGQGDDGKSPGIVYVLYGGPRPESAP